ncbi:MAG: glycosyltransferase [Proteobacteria bacterium]|nr:glycosyltransferase [Desulfobacula sp.]MBU3952266.1 glycosyltransferase [Pseudomonadota bacterium]MBU4133636.1 glycosyltransferase [Pseudomonadota bacterium]
MLKILFIIDHLGQGGAQKMLYYLSTGLVKKMNYQVVVVSLQKRNMYSGWFEKAGIKVIHCGIDIQGSPLETSSFVKTLFFSGWKMFLSFIKLLKLVAEFKPNVISTFLFGADFFGTAAGLFTRTKVVCAIRATNIWKRWWHKLASRLTYPFVSCFTVNSTRTAIYLNKKEGVPLSKIKCIFNGVDLKRPIVDCAAVREMYEVPDSVFWVVAVGRLDEQKGFEYLIQAAESLKNSGISFVLSIFGEGHLRALLENQIKALNLEAYVRLEGYAGDLKPVLLSADMFVLSSLYEGMPNVILEAMSMGLPIVAADVDGVCDIITHEKDGLMVQTKNPEDLYAALYRLCGDKDLRKKMSENGYERVKRNFSIESMCRQYHDLYQLVIADVAGITF